jgi:UDP-3-O-[3-hydroxymyristoyl] glucosamine N-acyltransferase
MTLQDLARQIGIAVIDNASGAEEITSVAAIQDAGEGSISFIANPGYEKYLATTQATAVIISDKFPVTANGTHLPALLRTSDPYLAFAKVLAIFNSRPVRQSGTIHPQAFIHPTAAVAPDVIIMAFAYIGENVRIGAGTVIHPNVTIYDGVTIGERVVIGAGTVIGSDGFGYAQSADGFRKVPQIGGVIIEDDVEIGANCTIDRATISNTIIRRGVKLDNLIHIAHNVEIGEDTVIAAQTGISGSAKIGKRNMIAGQVGLVGHIETADSVVIIAQSGVSKSLTKPGAYFGSPAKEHKLALKIEGAIRSLPELIDRVNELERHIIGKPETE